jgi:hypothetical protein
MPALEVPAAASKPASRSMGTARRLVVAWQHPVDRSIDPVGFLTYDGSFYRFAYIRNALQVKDFQPLLGFPDLYGSYRSTELFPLFAQRAMDPRRPDYHRYVERLGLEGEPGPWEQITRSQGRRHGDTIQLLPEPVVSGDELTCLFLVHGVQHAHEEPRILDGQEVRVTRQQVEGALDQLVPGDKLTLAPEPCNPINPLAIMVVGASVPVGWVPNLLAEDVRHLMDQATVTVTVEHVNGSDAPWHLRLLARLRAVPVGDVRFFVGERWMPLAGEQAQ